MKKLMAIALILMLLVCSACAQTVITVHGEGSTLISAQNAVITLGVQSKSKDVKTAQTNVNTAVAAIREKLIDSGCLAEDINTDRLNIYSYSEYSSLGKEQTYYQATSTLSIRTKEMDRIGEIIDLAFEAGANTLNGIEFGADSTEEAEQSAMESAMDDARRKAEILAAANGMQIKALETVTEGYISSYDSGLNNMSMKSVDAAEEARTQVQAAKLCITVSITATFIAE